MDDILAMVEGPSTSEITSFDQTDHTIFKELLAKSSVWDFYEISKEEYMNKDDGEKKSLILKYYNYMLQDKLLLFVSVFLLSGLYVSDIKLIKSVFSSIIKFSPLFYFLTFEIKFCSVFDALLANDSSSEEDKFCSVLDALLANDHPSNSSSEEKSSEVKLSLEKTSTYRIYLF